MLSLVKILTPIYAWKREAAWRRKNNRKSIGIILLRSGLIVIDILPPPNSSRYGGGRMSNSFKAGIRVAESIRFDTNAVQEREIEAAHLPLLVACLQVI